jgi:predicted nucleic acid-binding protein
LSFRIRRQSLALITIGKLDLLAELFGEVIIPSAVEMELRAEHSTLPAALRVKNVTDLKAVSVYRALVDPGEAEAIQLAKELSADRLLMDDAKGRSVAASEGLPVVGLVGVVLLAKRSGLIGSARETLDRLRMEAGAYFSDDLVASALKSVGE